MLLLCFLYFAGEGTLIMMTQDFNVICEFPYHSEEFGEGTRLESFCYTDVPVATATPKLLLIIIINY